MIQQNYCSTRTRGLFLTTVAAIVVCLSSVIAPSRAAEPSSLQRQAKGLVAAYQKSSGAVCGVSAVDLKTGQRLIDIRSGEPFVPASNQKLLTAAFALARLGADFRFTTGVYSLGDDILIVGDGDPTLGDPRLGREEHKDIYTALDRWADVVRQKVGKAIRGDLLVCSSFAQEDFRHADWPKRQHHRWYAAPVAGLNFHNNCFDVTFAVTDKGVLPNVQPQSRLIRITNGVKASKRHIWSLQSNADDSHVRLNGTVKRSTKDPVSVAANHPPLLLGYVLAERLARAGVKLTGSIRAVKLGELDRTKAELLCRTDTPLTTALKRANKQSLNMAAECIFLRAGDGTWAGSAKIMTDTLVERYGLAAEHLLVRDGGGLSRRNRIAPAAMTRTLATIAGQDEAKVLLVSLPRSGMDGTMRKRLRQPPYRGRVVAKTGYVAGASCLSGYIVDKADRPVIAFSIMANSVPAGKAWRAKQLQDSICKLMVDSADN